MGLSSLTLNGDVAKSWCVVLEQNGISAQRDEIHKNQVERDGISTRLVETEWRLREETAELPVLEVSYPDRNDGTVYIIFMPIRTEDQQELLSRVRELLVATGATVSVKNESRGSVNT